jgi:guanylate kinase
MMKVFFLKRIDSSKEETEPQKKTKFLNYVIINDNLDKSYNEFEFMH